MPAIDCPIDKSTKEVPSDRPPLLLGGGGYMHRVGLGLPVVEHSNIIWIVGKQTELVRGESSTKGPGTALGVLFWAERDWVHFIGTTDRLLRDHMDQTDHRGQNCRGNHTAGSRNAACDNNDRLVFLGALRSPHTHPRCVCSAESRSKPKKRWLRGKPCHTKPNQTTTH